MANYAGINKNDVVNGEGICVSFFMQGCPHHCKGCFNPETWDPADGKKITDKVLKEIIEAISANGIERNFSMLGGEPLAPFNLITTWKILTEVRLHYPKIKMFLWTGYTEEELQTYIKGNAELYACLLLVDTIITGRFIEEEKDLTLKLRGSRNQNIWSSRNLVDYLTK